MGLALGFTTALAAPTYGATYIEFDVPGATETAAVSINSSDAVTGSYTDARENQHGFVRMPNGAITTFDPERSRGTFPQAINAKGSIAGYYYKRKHLQWPAWSFLRAADGTITTFNLEGAVATFVSGINDKGVAVGYYFPSPDSCHGFLREPDGSATTLDVPGAVCTKPISINKLGAIAGNWGDGHRIQGFVRDADGKFVTFNTGGDRSQAWPQSIDNAGRIAGYNRGNHHVEGFFRDTEGAITKFEVPGSLYTFALHIADQNGTPHIVGYAHIESSDNEGFLWRGSGTITSFQAPHAGDQLGQGTFAQSLTAQDHIAGYYVDSNSVTHGFLLIP